MAQPTPTPSRPPTNLPERVSELIGRDVELDEILDLSASHRLVTLAGAGRIGKTRLGVEVARHLLPRFADGVWAIELAPLSDPELVPVAVATALGLELASGTASPLTVANALRSKQLMLVLDSCEHVVDAAAPAASHSGQRASGFTRYRRSLSPQKVARIARIRFATAPSGCSLSGHAREYLRSC
jgi:hypothetical protein